MKRGRWNVEKIISILKEADSGVSIAELCRRDGMTDATFYNWRKKYEGLEVSDALRLKELEEENRKLKRIVADQVLEITMLRDISPKKMVTPEAKREAVRYLKTEYRTSERQACQVVDISRGSHRYRKRPERNVELRAELYELAMEKPKYGCPLLFALLKRRGWKVNHKRVERLYRLLNLSLRRKKRAKRIVREREPLPVPSEPNQHWAMDFIHDSLWSGRKLRCLTLVDLCSRFAPAVEVGFSLPAERVIQVLDRLAMTRGTPSVITVDNGPEFICKALRAWCEKHGVKLDFIEPGKPTQNAFIESLNGTFRHECLDAHAFVSLDDAKRKIKQWRNEYNTERPHSSIAYRTPEELEIDFFQRMKENKKSTGTK